MTTKNQEPVDDDASVRVMTGSTCAVAVRTVAPEGQTLASLSSRRGWASVAAIALGAFIIVMTETLPVGLLPEAAEGLGVSLGLAGFLVLVPGVTAAVSAPLFFLTSRKYNRRTLILVLGLTVFISNGITAFAPNFAVVLVARVLFGATLGAFWTVVSPVGPKLVGRAAGTRAITMIAAGISGGTVVGLPAGQFLANLFGWRTTFAAAAAATLLVVVTQAVVLPSIPADGSSKMSDLARILRSRASQFSMAAGAVAFVGQFMAWTYITPFLMSTTHLPSVAISALYVVYGVGGIVGSIVAGTLFKRGVIASFAGAATVVAMLLLGLAVTGETPWIASLLFVLWGLFWGVVNPGTLVWMLEAAPDAPDAASAVNVTNLQIALAIGSALGAVLVSLTNLQVVFLWAGMVVLASAGPAAVALRKAPNRGQ